jgi:hypothetical protein
MVMAVSSSASQEENPCFEPCLTELDVIAAMLYSQIFQYLLTRPEVAELTLEDPSESFEDLRDKEDLKMLLENNVFNEKPMSELIPFPREWYEATRTKWKLASVSHPQPIRLTVFFFTDSSSSLEAIFSAARIGFAMEIRITPRAQQRKIGTTLSNSGQRTTVPVSVLDLFQLVWYQRLTPFSLFSASTMTVWSIFLRRNDEND